MDLSVLGRSVDLNFGKFSFSPSIIQAGVVVLLVFFLLLSVAQLRRHYISWSAKGAVFGVFVGFLLALLLEGFLVIGGRTALTELLGWKNPPKAVSNILDLGKVKLVEVLGIKNEIPSSFAVTNPTSEKAVEILQSLDPTEMKKVKNLICAP